jgi:hypothetical protein
MHLGRVTPHEFIHTAKRCCVASVGVHLRAGWAKQVYISKSFKIFILTPGRHNHRKSFTAGTRLNIFTRENASIASVDVRASLPSVICGGKIAMRFVRCANRALPSLVLDLLNGSSDSFPCFLSCWC